MVGKNVTAMGGIDTSTPSVPIYMNEKLFYTNLHEWMRSASGGRYRSNVHWNDEACNNGTDTSCKPINGIREARWQATLSLEETSTGQKRYETMTSVRNKVKDIFKDAKAFPYSFK